MKIKLNKALNIKDLAQQIDAQLPEAALPLSGTLITHLDTLDDATAGCISFLSNPIYKKHLASTKASAIIVTPDDAKECPSAALISNNPRLSLAKLLQLCDTVKVIEHGIHPSAVIGANAQLGNNLSVAAHCSIGANVKIGDNVTLESGVVLGDNVTVGAGSYLRANVTVYHDVVLGQRCSIHSGTVVGSDGFGYAHDGKNGWVKMPHLGSVIIGDDVEIGSNTSIDRGMIDNTVIGNQVIIDNLVQLGHNVVIGDRTAIAGCAGIAGSTSVGKNCLIGGAACIAGHISICDNVSITGTSSVNNTITEPGVYSSGFPARENSTWRRNIARFMMLDSMAKRIKELEKHMVKEND